METLLSSQKRVISYHFCTLASSPPSCPPYPPHPAQKTLALKAVEFPRVKSLKKFIDRLLKFQEVSQGVFFFTSKVFLLRFFASNVICTNLSVNNLRCFYEQSERSLICTLALYSTKKSHYAISMWQIPTPKIFFLPRSFTFSPEFRPERNKVRWSLFHIWRTSGRTASPTRTFQQNNPPSENKWWDAFLSFFFSLF